MPPPAADAVHIRAARLPDEATALAHANHRAYREDTPQNWVAYYANPYMHHKDGVLVAERDGRLAGQCVLLRFDAALAGVDVPMIGIAAVGVAPEHRRTGVADKLMRDALRRIRKAGVPIAMLYPYSVAFYRRFGYELCEWADLLRVAPAQLVASPLRRNVRPLDLLADDDEVRALYERCRLGTTGPFRRDEHWWTKRVWTRAQEWFGYQDPGTGRLEGVLGYNVPAHPAHPYQIAQVYDFWAATPDAYAGLVGLLATLGEQFVRVETYLPRGYALPLLVEHGRNDIEVESQAHIGAYTATCAMARLVDVAAAFAAHPGPARVRGRIGIDLTDPVFPDQTRGFDVSFGARGAHVVPGERSRARLSLSIQRLSQVYFAAATATQLCAQGLAHGSASAAALLDAAFAGPPLHLGPANFF